MAYSAAQKQEILEKVVNQMIDGRSIRSICAEGKDLPDRVTLLRWMNDDEEFAAIIARASELRAESLHDDMADICQKMESGELDANTGKAIIWAKQWSASKLKPRKFGDKVTTEHTGSVEIAAIERVIRK